MREENNQLDPSLEASANRYTRLNDRMGQSSIPGSPSRSQMSQIPPTFAPMSPTTGATTSLAELQAMRAAQDVQNSATPGRECLIYFEVRRSDSPKHLDDTLGTGCLTLLETVSMLGKLCPVIPCAAMSE